jgi:putative membrane protein
MNPEHARWLTRPPRRELSNRLRVAAWIFTAAVLALVGLMRQVKIPLPEGVSLSFLPPVHAALNAAVAVVLVAALIAVKTGRILLHRRMIVVALTLSALFLLGYVAYHFTSNEVRFGDLNLDGAVDETEKAEAGGTRTLYLALLASHIILAAVSLPFILFTFIAGWTDHFASHRRLARWVFPIWLYVAVTGPACYWMLRPYYP